MLGKIFIFLKIMILYKDFTAVIPAAGKGVGLIKIKISYYTKLKGKQFLKMYLIK